MRLGGIFLRAAAVKRLCVAAMLMFFAGALAAAPVRVVATFSVLGDMVSVIGGENVEVVTLVGPETDSHGFEPTARENRMLAQAQVLVSNGLGFEGWLPRLVKASGFDGLEIVASKGVEPRQLASHDDDHNHDGHDHGDEGDVDPHAWQDLANGMQYARNIANGLARIDPAHRAKYQERARVYVEEMQKLHDEIKGQLEAVPEQRRRVVTAHDAFGYFGQAYGVTFIPIAGISSDAEPSAREMADIIRLIRESKGVALFDENATGASRILEQIARDTGLKVGGVLYSDTLASVDQPAGTYLGMFKWNAGRVLFSIKP
ncbi:MAG: metal ABC transporter substrate-binding protein [Pusillimonas sp.]|jgi:zinc/manganese transport system substrate-binding protein|nr:metal ABC transporter substrate-binding protein [Pusillimonas sp.]|tara:strand:+ start:168 stop:1118 length:951 start_codon:yes stop_codon:yes gene_type:complete